jgi:pyruvate-ferredoxin/flavodoxin oxidoreductase
MNRHANQQVVTIDGNEAAAYIAYRVNEICAIYPITPSSTMGELADQWATEGQENIWGNIPMVVEMQSEGGAAGAVHGALQTGALSTTFTASQGLLLMIPNMYKIAGELTPVVLHVAARSLACQGLSIFGDHSDVMAVRSTGFALLCSSSPQEAHDLALIAQASTLEARVPFVHFFDGFRTSHEINKVTLLADTDIRAMISDELVRRHRTRGLSPDHPVIRGTAQNPDVYFQARETVNTFYASTPHTVQRTMDRFAELTGRRYRLFDYYGHPEAERVVMVMGSGAETVRETVEFLQTRGEAVGLLQVHLFRPFSAVHFIEALPLSTRAIAVLDRTKEPGAPGEPLYSDVVTTLAESLAEGKLSTNGMPQVIGGRYGLSSKEFTPAMVKAVLDELKERQPKNHFTIGINDDVTHKSLEYDPQFIIEPENVVRAMFFGLGADGTVGANKNSIKIIGEETNFCAQGFFVYDSKKSGSQTISHLRFGPDPIRSTYLIQSANFIGCHQFDFLEKSDLLKSAAPGSILLLNSSAGADDVWDKLPRRVQEVMVEKGLKFYGIDAYKVALETGMGRRINTIMQTCFFAISGVLPRDEAIKKIKGAIEKTYRNKGPEIVRKNFAAVDHTLSHLWQVEVPKRVSSIREISPPVPATAPEFVRRVTAMMMAGRGDELPVSALPADGTYPTGTTAWEKRNISQFVPVWESDICIQCGNCSLVCPHSVIRSKLFHESRLEEAPTDFRSAPLTGRGFPETRYTLQVFVEDCTGCGLCVEVCPAKSKEQSGVKAINMRPKAPVLEDERRNIAFFQSIPESNRGRIDFGTVRGVQYLQPLFEFSGACAGCGETPYLKLLSQLFGDRLVIANATGCSSIYGGNLPTTPWAANAEGRGPAWANSLFEDNAEFGFGFRLSTDKHRAMAEQILSELSPQLGAELVEEILNAAQDSGTACPYRHPQATAGSARYGLEQTSPDGNRSLGEAQRVDYRRRWLGL